MILFVLLLILLSIFIKLDEFSPKVLGKVSLFLILFSKYSGIELKSF